MVGCGGTRQLLYLDMLALEDLQQLDRAIGRAGIGGIT
jgi:hypothetical protein